MDQLGRWLRPAAWSCHHSPAESAGYGHGGRSPAAGRRGFGWKRRAGREGCPARAQMPAPGLHVWVGKGGGPARQRQLSHTQRPRPGSTITRSAVAQHSSCSSHLAPAAQSAPGGHQRRRPPPGTSATATPAAVRRGSPARRAPRAQLLGPCQAAAAVVLRGCCVDCELLPGSAGAAQQRIGRPSTTGLAAHAHMLLASARPSSAPGGGLGHSHAPKARNKMAGALPYCPERPAAGFLQLMVRLRASCTLIVSFGHHGTNAAVRAGQAPLQTPSHAVPSHSSFARTAMHALR